MLRQAGINLSQFGSHSTRAAAASAASLANVPLQTILKTAGWSQASTFRKLYDKPVARDTTFASGVLTHFEKNKDV